MCSYYNYHLFFDTEEQTVKDSVLAARILVAQLVEYWNCARRKSYERLNMDVGERSNRCMHIIGQQLRGKWPLSRLRS
jgi:hypothetical protein